MCFHVLCLFQHKCFPQRTCCVRGIPMVGKAQSVFSCSMFVSTQMLPATYMLCTGHSNGRKSPKCVFKVCFHVLCLFQHKCSPQRTCCVRGIPMVGKAQSVFSCSMFVSIQMLPATYMLCTGHSNGRKSPKCVFKVCFHVLCLFQYKCSPQRTCCVRGIPMVGKAQSVFSKCVFMFYVCFNTNAPRNVHAVYGAFQW